METPTASSVVLDAGVVAGSGRRARDVEAGAVPGPSARADGRDADAAAGAARIDAIDTIDTVDALLPQTQCRRCGYHACRPYAEAMVRGDAEINRCPPGGEATVAALAGALGRPVIALDPACGAVGRREAARIDESACIGCAVCIRACPVDAIIGARKWMHVVLESECTGCGLCVEPCPVDCISMVPARTGPATAAAWLAERAPLARRRFERRRARESALEAAPPRRERADRIDAVASLRTRTVEQRRTDIAAAVARVKARTEAAHPGAEDFGAVARVEARTEAAHLGTEDFGAVARTRARAEAAGKAWGGERRS